MSTIRRYYEQLREIRAVSSLAEFSHFCGRKKSWASSFICRGLEMPTDALTSVYCNILQIRDVALENQKYEIADEYNPLLKHIWFQICYRVKERSRELQ